MPTCANILEAGTLLPRAGDIFPRLPVLENVISVLSPGPQAFEDVGLVCVQHLLETTGSLFESLLRCGLAPHNVFVLGKLYSNCPDVQHRLRSLGIRVMDSHPPRQWGKYQEHFQEEAAQLWRQITPLVKAGRFKKLLVLDDGGHAVTSLPASLLSAVEVIGVEQTMSGTFLEHLTKRSIPVIDVASSAAKTLIEAPLIAAAVIKKVADTILDLKGSHTFGIVGFGNVGRAICDSLVSQGKTVYVFDVRCPTPSPQIPGISICETLEELFTKCDYIFGCTGRDILADLPWWRELHGGKVLVSCSSNDIEFGAVIDTLNESSCPTEATALGSLTVALEKGCLTILRGGYPINFDGTCESVPSIQIQMTRGLLLGALFQAMTSPQTQSRATRSAMLSPNIQQLVVKNWIGQHADLELFYGSSTRALFDNTEEIAKLSGGTSDISDL